MFCYANAGQLNKRIPVYAALPQDGFVSNTVILPLFHSQQLTNNQYMNYHTSWFTIGFETLRSQCT